MYQILGRTEVKMATSLVDYGFYLIQRGEAGHLRGCYTNEYKDCGI